MVDNTQDTTPVWLITGTSAGFGQAIARAAIDRGDTVIATARRPDTLESLVGSAPEQVLALELDVTKQDTIDGAVAAALERFGRIDVLVNNAGFGTVGAVEELAMADLRRVMETMYFGPVALTQAVLPHMRARRSGAIIQISSMGGQISAPGFAAYCSAKWALEGLSECLAAEVKPHGIRVMIVEPGAFRTEFGGARLHRSAELPAYAETVGQTRAALDAMDGTQPGDPSRAAAAIIRALEDPDAPLHIALGADAVEAIRAAQQQRSAELAAWEQVSVDTALPA